MKLDTAFLAILVCPNCKGQLDYEADNNRLVCRLEKIAYEITREGIPVLLPEKATAIDEPNPE